MLTYPQILKQVALRTGYGSLAGSTMAEIAASYDNIGAAAVDSAAFPFKAMQDAMLLAEEKMAQVVSSVKNHPLRTYIRSVTDELASGEQMPPEDENGDPIIGVIGAVYDAADEVSVLTRINAPNPAKAIARLNRLIENEQIKAKHYLYCIEGSSIIHTRESVFVEVCVYNRSQQEVILNSEAQQVLFPDALEEAYVCGTIRYLFRDDEAPATAQQYAAYFDQWVMTNSVMEAKA